MVWIKIILFYRILAIRYNPSIWKADILAIKNLIGVINMTIALMISLK